jgi:hypothetical protein
MVTPRNAGSHNYVHFLCLSKENEPKEMTLFLRQLLSVRLATEKPSLNRLQGFADSLRLGFPLLAEKEKRIPYQKQRLSLTLREFSGEAGRKNCQR